jgi:beta-galactosidase
MSLIQGQKLINYYLFSGGINHRLTKLENKGNDRISFTGQHHGFAAPIDPIGNKQYHYEGLSNVSNLFKNLESKFVNQSEVLSDIVICFIPDYYMTEYHYEKSKSRNEMRNNLILNRSSTYFDALKHLLLLHYSFEAITIDKINNIKDQLLIIGLSKYLDSTSQTNIIKYLKSKKKLIIIGELPIYDYYGDDCTLLIDYLKVSHSHNYFDWIDTNLSIIPNTEIFKDECEYRSFYANTYKHNYKSLFNVYGNNESCGFINDNLVYIGNQIPGHLEYMKSIMEYYKIKPLVELGNDSFLVLSFLTKNKETSESFLHLINLSDIDKNINYNNFDFKIKGQKSLMLPINIKQEYYTIEFSTTEIINILENSFIAKIGINRTEIIVINSNKDILISGNVDFIINNDNKYYIYISSYENELIEVTINL